MYLTIIAIHFMLVLFLSMVYRKREMDRYGNVFFGLAILLFVVIVAFRPGDAIPDVESYQLRYVMAIQAINYQDIFRVGYLAKVPFYSMGVGASLVSYLFGRLGFSFSAFSFIIALIEITIVIRVSEKILFLYNVHINRFLILLMTMVMYGYYYMFIAYAQGIVMALILLEFYLFLKNKYFLGLLVVGFSLSFHLIGIAGIAIILIYKFVPELNRKVYGWVWIITTALIGIGSGFKLNQQIGKIVGNLINFAVNFNPLYSGYDVIETGGRVSIINVVVCLYIGLLIYSHNNIKEYWKYINILLVAMILMALFPSWFMMHRFYDVLLMFIIIATCMRYSNYGRSRIIIKQSEVSAVFIFAFLKFASMMSIFYTFGK